MMAVRAPDHRLVVCPTLVLKSKKIDSRCMPLA
jgi:hypothetical protein